MNERAETQTNDMDAPSGLDLNPRPPRSVRVSRRAGGTLIAVAAVVLGLFAYGGYKRQQRQVATLAEKSMPQNVAPATAAGVEIAKDVPSGNVPIMPAQRPGGEDPALLQPPTNPQLQPGQTAPNGGQVFVRQAPIPPAPVAPQIPQPREPSPEERRLLAAYEREQQAIGAPTSLRESFGSVAVADRPQSPPATQIASLPQLPSRQNRTSPVEGDPKSDGQSAKEAFIGKALTEAPNDYLKSTRTLPLSQYEIKAGWEIPAVLEQSLNSDLPGELKALVSSNVYDTATGRHLLIPQGARLVGVYNSRVGCGQDGVQVIWERVIYPDGSSLDLLGMIGQDANGFSGFRDKVDRHYTRLVGFAVLTSLFSAASQLSQNQNRSLLAYPSSAQVAGSAVGQQASELGAQVTRRNLNVQPTIKVSIGYRFNVRVNRDILFDAPYAPVSANR